MRAKARSSRVALCCGSREAPPGNAAACGTLLEVATDESADMDLRGRKQSTTTGAM
jgi:hypothetical protein